MLVLRLLRLGLRVLIFLTMLRVRLLTAYSQDGVESQEPLSIFSPGVMTERLGGRPGTPTSILEGISHVLERDYINNLAPHLKVAVTEALQSRPIVRCLIAKFVALVRDWGYADSIDAESYDTFVVFPLAEFIWTNIAETEEQAKCMAEEIAFYRRDFGFAPPSEEDPNPRPCSRVSVFSTAAEITLVALQGLAFALENHPTSTWRQRARLARSCKK